MGCRLAPRVIWTGVFSAGLLLLIGLLKGCAVNPVSGRQDFVLMSEQEEIALGREYSQQIAKEYPRYDDAALQAYVQGVGERLGALSHRANLIYRYTVVDSAEVNAFALPGGYIYITRGLMAYLNSEAELAAVLGHETGHVTARHSVRQQSAATVTGLLGSVAAAAVGVQGAGDLFNVLGAALVQGYGRDHELEADRLGAEYITRAGYPSQAMTQVIGVLKNQEQFDIEQARAEGRRPRVYHGVFASHPDNDRRLQEVVAAAGQLAPSTAPRGAQRDAYLQHIDGLVFGDSEDEGVRRGRDFFHGKLGFGIRFPEGWIIDNLPERVIARARDGSASLQLLSEDLNQRITPREFMQTRMKADIARGEALDLPDGLSGYTALVDGQTPYGQRRHRVSVIFFEQRAYVVFGAGKADALSADLDHAFRANAESFHRLTAHERTQAKPQVLALVRADAGTRIADLAQRSSIANHPEQQLRLLNDLYPSGEPRPGQMIKVVR